MMTYKQKFFFAILGMIAVAVGTTLSAHLLKPVLDDVFINKDAEMLKFIPFAIIGVFMLKYIGRFVQTYYMVYIGDDIVRKLRDKLARHLMYQPKSPEILILDEATSALDNKSEKAIQKALEVLKDEMITFVVAHRLSTVEKADSILLFEAGEIIERGSYSELLKNSTAFRKLANQGESQ